MFEVPLLLFHVRPVSSLSFLFLCALIFFRFSLFLAQAKSYISSRICCFVFYLYCLSRSAGMPVASLRLISVVSFHIFVSQVSVGLRLNSNTWGLAFLHFLFYTRGNFPLFYVLLSSENNLSLLFTFRFVSKKIQLFSSEECFCYVHICWRFTTVQVRRYRFVVRSISCYIHVC